MSESDPRQIGSRRNGGVRRFVRSYADLDVYQRGMSLLKPVHDLALTLPDYEKYDLANQMRRACKSVPTNIAEGYGRRRSPKEFKQFLTTAMGSATEMEVHLEIAHRLGYVGDQQFTDLQDGYRVIARQLYRLIEHWHSVDTRPPNSDLSEPRGGTL